MIATKASRVVWAAQGRPVIEFGLRRTQGTDAGMKAAKCSYLAGAYGTSNVLAGMKYDIPVYGTMAHSYVMFFDREIDSFRAFARTFPHNSTFLIDTYDDLEGAENAAIIAKEMERQGYRLNAVRLDSGDLAATSRKVRRILDKQGLDYVKIFASGDLDEYAIENLIKKGANIDAFGVGTRMSTSHDRPYVDVVYKLSGKTEQGVFIPAMKLSKQKVTLPGRKQTFRLKNKDRRYIKDVIGLQDETIPGERLLAKVMEGGRIIGKTIELKEARTTTLKNLSELPEKYKKLTHAPLYPVRLSRRLTKSMNQLAKKLKTDRR
jgi:nicotinate phosphoribosyltransferase